MPITYFLRTLFTVLLSVFVLSLSSASAEEMTQAERNEMAAKLIPIITMLLMDGDSNPPAKPSLTTPLGSEVDVGTVSVELNGEVGAKVFANGVQVGVIGSSGKATVVLTFVNGVNAMSITLQDKAGNVSEPLTFSVSYDAPPVITLVGDKDILMYKDESYVELGATAEDINDGTASIDITGTVNISLVGEYNVTYSASDTQGNTATEVRKVHVLPAHAVVVDFPFDITEVEGYDGATDPENLLGIIKNQFWIQAFGKLTEIELRQAVATYPTLTVIGYSPSSGLLVQISTDSVEAMSALKTLELDVNIVKVRNRVHKGSNLLAATSSIPDGLPIDGHIGSPEAFDDGGANWHLEYIHMPEAWEITKGSAKVAVGVMDSGFVTGHEDLTIKVGNRMTTEIGDHGSACASIIGATTNNRRGISGINMVSPLVVSNVNDKSNIEDIFSAEDGEKVKVVSVSVGWGLKQIKKSGYTPSVGIALAYNQDLRDKIGRYQDKLFVYAAGNEGKDASMTNGALHYRFKNNSVLTFNDEESLEKVNQFKNVSVYKVDQKKDNILVVAALLRDGKLPEYSSYGDSVDIAAPTGMKAVKNKTRHTLRGHVYYGYTYFEVDKKYYGTDYKNTYSFWDGSIFDGENDSLPFNGTSAAAPVVAGVASLIYSLNPDFTPQEVKRILIDSAIRNPAKERHTVQGYDDDDANEYDKIPGHDIPILDAGAALKMAKDIVDAKKATLTHYYPSVFSKKCNIYVKPPVDTLNVSSLDLTVKAEKEDGSWVLLSSFTPTDSVLSDNTPEVAFVTNKKYKRYKAEGTVTYMGHNAINVNTTFNHTLVDSHQTIIDKISKNALTNAVTKVEYLDDFRLKDVEVKTLIDTNTVIYYFDKLSRYKVSVAKENYKDFTTIVKYTDKHIVEDTDTIPMTPSSTEAQGDISLEVHNEDGKVIANAQVEMTTSSASINSTYTDIWGIVKLLNIPMLNAVDEFIKYDVNISRLGYLPVVKTIALVDGKTVTEAVTLQKDPNYTNIPPVAQAGADQSITLGQSVTLSASTSSDVETAHASLTYKWSSPSMTTSHEENVTISGLALGVHHITLEVTDEWGAVATDIVDVTVGEEGVILHNGTTYGTVTSPYTGRVWLDRNLGASQVCTSFNDTACYGDYYQWGRNFDGHQDANSPTTSVPATDVDSAGSSFITSTFPLDDWASTDSNGSLRSENWSKTDGSSVCPVGFRVPTITELQEELQDPGSAQITNNTDAFNSFLKLPSAGNRYSGSGVLDGQGSRVYVWASSVGGDSYTSGVKFDSGYAYWIFFYARAFSFTVRCLRD